MKKLVMNISDLAIALGLAQLTIRRHLYGMRRVSLLNDLPAPVSRRPKLVWIEADIRDWLDSKRTFNKPTELHGHNNQITEIRATISRGRPKRFVKNGVGK